MVACHGLRAVAAFITGFASDSLVIGLVALVAWTVGRILRGRAARRLTSIGAFVVGLYITANVYLVVTFGSPLTLSMLAYRQTR